MRYFYFLIATFLLLLTSIESLQFRVFKAQNLRSRSTNPIIKGSESTQRSLTSLSAAPILALPNQVGGTNWWIWSLLAASSSLGIVLENTKIGAMLSSPLVTMGLSLLLCNVGVLPSSSPVYSTVLKVCQSHSIIHILNQVTVLTFTITSTVRCLCRLLFPSFYWMLTCRSVSRAQEHC